MRIKSLYVGAVTIGMLLSVGAAFGQDAPKPETRRVERVEQGKANKRQQCKGTTKAGKRCRRTVGVSKATGFCRAHAAHAATIGGAK